MKCIDEYGKCIQTTFDMPTCVKKSETCVINCQSQPAMIEVETPHVQSLKCDGCKFAADKIEDQIASYGCKYAKPAIVGSCELFLGGPEDPLADLCAVGFVRECPTIAGWIEKKVFSPQRACQLIRMC